MADNKDDYPHEHDAYLEEMDRKERLPPQEEDRGGGRPSRERDERAPSREPQVHRERSRDRDVDRGRDREADRRDPDRGRDREPDRREERDFGRGRSREEDRRRPERQDDRRGEDRRRSRSRDRDSFRRRSRSPSRDRFEHRRDDRDRDGGGGGGGGWREGGGRRGGGGRGGGSGSGRRDDSDDEAYGGYKPRRRQQGDRPPHRRPPQDPAKYDKPLPPGAGPGYIQDPFYYLRQNVPTDPAEAQRLWLEQQLRSRQMVLQQQAISAAAASAKTQRELYIGNLVPGAVTDVALRQLFNATLTAAFPAAAAGSDPVCNVNLHSDGRYAFVEFRSPEMATAALALNAQVQLLGQTISVGRPSGYVDPTKASTAAVAAGQALAAFQAGDMDALAANAAAAGMNLAQLGLANLMMPKPVGGAVDTAAAAAAGVPAAAAVGMPEGTAELPLPPPPPLPPTNGGVAPAAHQEGQHQGGEAAAANGGGGGEEATPYFAVAGMLTADLLQDDEEYESVVEDLRDECDRHTPGGVAGVKVPRPPPELRGSTDFMGRGNYGKAFVAFRDALAAQRAHAAIHGRLFAGSTVQVTYISGEEFAAVA